MDRCITGTGGVIPKTVRKLYDLALSGLAGDAGALAEAMSVQDRVAAADWTLIKGGVQGTVSQTPPIPVYPSIETIAGLRHCRSATFIRSFFRLICGPSLHLAEIRPGPLCRTRARW